MSGLYDGVGCRNPYCTKRESHPHGDQCSGDCSTCHDHPLGYDDDLEGREDY